MIRIVRKKHGSERSSLRAMRLGAPAAAALGLAIAAQAAHSQIPCSYDVQVMPEIDCGPFKGSATGSAINNNGTVVGTFACEGSESFYWNAGEPNVTVIPRPSWVLSFVATDISNDGVVVGFGETTRGLGGTRGLIYDMNGGEWTEIPPQNDPAGQSTIYAINEVGQVCGYRSIDDGGDPMNPVTAFIWSAKDGFMDIKVSGPMAGPSSGALDINDNGMTVGWTGLAIGVGTNVAFVFENDLATVLGPVPGGMSSSANAINTSGQVMISGRMNNPPNVIVRVFLYENGVFTILPLLPGYDRSGGADISAKGTIVGLCNQLATGANIGCLWVDGQVYELNSLIDPALGLYIAVALGGNDSGQVIARGEFGLLLTPIEPLMGDANCDGDIDVDDIAVVIQTWGSCIGIGCEADFTGDREVNVDDLLVVLQNWTG
jgi:uncharacterized membrane protein